ncbi:hypothetical protein ACH9DO_13800 [Kocuria sp. M1N1S27]|uniref:hypothetical protein n=1 Tax=Kocuria kalidii TaxID=3376283 RepID=UPI003794E1BF
MTPIYRLRTVIPEFVPQGIAAAYAVAGVKRPTPPEQAIEAAIRELPTAATVGPAIVAEAHDGPLASPSKFAADALRRMSDALAADALRDAWNRHGSNATTVRLPQATDRAAADLAPSFAATREALRGAADALIPQGAPEDTTHGLGAGSTPRRPTGQATLGPVSMDPEAAIARDAGAALTAARTELARLANFAGISAVSPLSNSAASALAQLVPVVAIEGAVMERCIRSVGEGLTVTNETQLSVTRAVRRLAADARADVDAAILGIARD